MKQTWGTKGIEENERQIIRKEGSEEGPKKKWHTHKEKEEKQIGEIYKKKTKGTRNERK